MILLHNEEGNASEFLGTFPIMQELSKQDELNVIFNPAYKDIFELMPGKYNIKSVPLDDQFTYKKVLRLDMIQAKSIAEGYNYYVSQAHFHYLGFPVPKPAPKGDMVTTDYDSSYIAYHYAIAPFTADRQAWPRDNWQSVINRNSDKLFVIFGGSDAERNFVTGDNVHYFYNKTPTEICIKLRQSMFGLVGLKNIYSQYAFHLGVKTLLLNNKKDTWLTNPDALIVPAELHQIKVADICRGLKRLHDISAGRVIS